MKTIDELIEQHAQNTPYGLDSDQRNILRRYYERGDREQKDFVAGRDDGEELVAKYHE